MGDDRQRDKVNSDSAAEFRRFQQRFISGDAQSDRETSPIPFAAGINTRISSTAASRTRPGLKPTTCGFTGGVQKVTGDIQRVGHQVFKNAPIIGVAPGDNGAACRSFISKPLLDSNRKNLADFSSANAAARFKKTRIEKQTMARAHVDSRIPGQFPR